VCTVGGIHRTQTMVHILCTTVRGWITAVLSEVTEKNVVANIDLLSVCMHVVSSIYM